MANVKEEIVGMLNKALGLEHAARIQYLSHAEQIKGINAEPVIARLREIASDEEKHEAKFRNLIGGCLGQAPSMGLAATHEASGESGILEANLKGEKEAIVFYKQIYRKVTENKEALTYEYETLEHEIRHVIIDEQEHVVELSLLLGK